MTDYLEELLEEWAEERGDEETPELPRLRWSAPRPAPPGGSRRDVEAEKRRGEEGGEAFARRTGTLTAAEGTGEHAFSDAPGDAPIRERRGDWGERGGVYQLGTAMAETLRGRLRRGTAAAAYRVGTPSFPETAERSTARERPLTELDAAFRRDARRYDGGFELY